MVICIGMKDGYGDRCENLGNGHEDIQREDNGDGF